MSSIKNAYGTVVTTVTSPISTLEKVLERRKQRTLRNRIVKQASKEAEACLALGRIYKQQNNLLAARSVYKQGLSYLLMDDAQHIQLQKEMQTVSATIHTYNQQLYNIPHEIWSMVFNYLTTYRDVQQCAMASAVWCDVFLTMPEFWSPPWSTGNCGWISKGHLSSDTESTMIQISSTTSGCYTFSNDWWFQELFKVLACWSSNTFHTLVLKNLNLSRRSPLVHCLVEMLESIDPPFRHVVFGPDIHMNTLDVQYILDSCSRIEHVSFSGYLDSYPWNCYHDGCCENICIRVCSIELPLLTYLEWTFDGCNGMELLPDVIRRCPSLMHLTMDDDEPNNTTYYRRSIKEALECCSRLKTLNVGTRLRLTDKMVTTFGYDRSSTYTAASGTPSTAQGINTLNYLYRWTYDDLCFITNKSYGSLEFLYLSYINYQDKDVEVQPLRTLYGAPNLRKTTFRLWSDDDTWPPSSITRDMINFFSAAFSLEEIVLDFGCCSSEDDAIPEVDDILLSIGKSCRLLRRLEITGDIYFAADSLLEFAAAAGPNLTHLKIPMDYQPHAIELALKLTTLVYFRFSNICYKRYDRNDSSGYSQQSWSCIDAIELIMKERRAQIKELDYSY